MPVTDILHTATHAAREAGAFIKSGFAAEKTVNEMKRYDIKLEMDVRSQQLITELILAAHPDHRVLGEEGDANQGGSGEVEWIVDPIDGTVNYFYGIPHFCVSIAARLHDTGKVIAGVIYDPMMDELWQVGDGVPPTLNGVPIQTSRRAEMAEAAVTAGFSKSRESLEAGFDRYRRISLAVRKTRMLGSAALAMAYVASGRLDAYVEEHISLWDVAAGWMLVEAAGGRVITRPPAPGKSTFFICAWNGLIPIEDYL
jgi:myo-inositol-1(or 4)-monophosphatase